MIFSALACATSSFLAASTICPLMTANMACLDSFCTSLESLITPSRSWSYLSRRRRTASSSPSSRHVSASAPSVFTSALTSASASASALGDPSSIRMRLARGRDRSRSGGVGGARLISKVMSSTLRSTYFSPSYLRLRGPLRKSNSSILALMDSTRRRHSSMERESPSHALSSTYLLSSCTKLSSAAMYSLSLQGCSSLRRATTPVRKKCLSSTPTRDLSIRLLSLLSRAQGSSPTRSMSWIRVGRGVKGAGAINFGGRDIQRSVDLAEGGLVLQHHGIHVCHVSIADQADDVVVGHDRFPDSLI
mmetsp:Transcript_12907/g.28677  ORF Transcript_12907/g.28677 Transcript_12907/m.28677 type:complete len:305 (+) Transcript_12907:3745-4659(+)